MSLVHNIIIFKRCFTLYLTTEKYTHFGVECKLPDLNAEEGY